MQNLRLKFTGLLDKVNDRFTSYRLMLYFLLAIITWSVIGGTFHKVGYNWHQILLSTGWLVAVCWTVNKLLSKFLDIPANKESDLISALILSLILSPPTTVHGFAILGGAGLVAMVSKYIIVIYKSHIFNPAAAGAFIAGQFFHQYASWWVGTKFITPVVVIGGLLILRKTKRFTMFATFMAVYIGYLFINTSSGVSGHFLWLELVSTQVFFFAIVMLTEPLTSPTHRSKYIPYALLVGVLYSATRLGIPPEEALLIGNLLTFVVSPNRRYQLKFLGKIKEAEGIYSYVFSAPTKFKFLPGQYMEWSVAHSKTDSRGNRRYLTVSASPTEKQLMFTVKKPPNASSFKQKLDTLKAGDTILAGHLAGSFTLPSDQSKKIAFLAGGIGVTPFRSMVKYLVDKDEQRDVALLYSASSPGEVSFHKLFDEASRVGVRSSFITEGYLDQPKIKKLLPDFADRDFYISGPYGFVQAVEQALLQLGVGPSKIVTDYFPGYGS